MYRYVYAYIAGMPTFFALPNAILHVYIIIKLTLPHLMKTYFKRFYENSRYF